jgi:hypothetical protein
MAHRIIEQRIVAKLLVKNNAPRSKLVPPLATLVDDAQWREVHEKLAVVDGITPAAREGEHVAQFHGCFSENGLGAAAIGVVLW